MVIFFFIFHFFMSRGPRIMFHTNATSRFLDAVYRKVNESNSARALNIRTVCAALKLKPIANFNHLLQNLQITNLRVQIYIYELYFIDNRAAILFITALISSVQYQKSNCFELMCTIYCCNILQLHHFLCILCISHILT